MALQKHQTKVKMATNNPEFSESFRFFFSHNEVGPPACYQTGHPPLQAATPAR